MAEHFDLTNIRALLREGFTYEELRRLCYDQLEFRPVYEQLSPEMGKDRVIDKLIEYAEQKDLLGVLLTLAGDLNPARFKKHQPYTRLTPAPPAGGGDPPESKNFARRSAMNPHPDSEAITQLLELLAIHHGNRRELERREARYESHRAPLDLRNDLVEVREQIDEVEGRLQAATATAAGPESVVRLIHAAEVKEAETEATHVQALIRTRRRVIDELEKRKAGYGPGQAPLELLNNLAAEQEALTTLENRLRRGEARLADLRPSPKIEPAPAVLHLTIATPDQARYETEVPADLLVAQLQTAFLESWQPPGDDEALVRYTMRLEGQALEPALTLAQANIENGATLALTAEPLTAESPVGLVVQGPAGERYTTAVRLDTTVRQLAEAFMATLGQAEVATIELITGSAEDQRTRPLRPDTTLYEARVGEGAQLRILPTAS